MRFHPLLGQMVFQKKHVLRKDVFPTKRKTLNFLFRLEAPFKWFHLIIKEPPVTLQDFSTGHLKRRS